ncbi:RNA exonuclease 1 homolog [Anabrus simplex]|uniref:RNA exonuclease 1 homolog n=1 Tax=Anabrus simplex TaxID=316456 RepID=UPI0035A2B764
MLPSTGYFKETACPFYESGLCERPYCHFRHVKKETPDNLHPATVKGADEILHRIVSQAVKKVLQQQTENSVGCVSSEVSSSSEAAPKPPEESAADEPVAATIEDTKAQDSSNDTTEQTKVPSYKPTPIAVLKKRHIPIPYSPSLTKSSNIILKRRSSDGTPFVRKRPKLIQEYEPDSSGEKFSEVQSVNSVISSSLKCEQSDKSKSSAESSVRHAIPDSSVVTSTSYKPTCIGSTPHSLISCSVSSSEGSGIGNEKRVILNKEFKYEPSSRDLKKSDKCPKYSPAPVGGWSDNRHLYIPSNIESLQQQQNSYVPVGRTSDLQSAVSYKPSDITLSSSEPTYVPSGTNSSTLNHVTYKPSSISNVEPEYQPLSTDNLVKEYVPTEISKLDSMGSDGGIGYDPVTNGLDSLHDITNDNLKAGSCVDKYGMLKVKREFKEEKDGNVPVNGEIKISSDDKRTKVREKSDSYKKHIKSEKKTYRDEEHHRDFQKHSESKRHSGSEKAHSSSSKRDNDGKSHHRERRSHESDKSSKKHDKSSKEDHKKHSSADGKHSSSQKKSHISSSEHSKHTSNRSNAQHQSTKNVKKVEHYHKSAKDKSHNLKDKSNYQGDNKKKLDSSGKQKPYTTTYKHEVYGGQSSEEELLKKPTRSSKSSVHHSSRTSHPATVTTSRKKQAIEENSSSDDSPERTCGSEVEDTASDIVDSEDYSIMEDFTLPNDTGASSPEDSVTQECRRIFEECQPSKSVPTVGTKRHAEFEEEQAEIPSKRVAAEGSASSSKPNPSQVSSKITAGQLMAEQLRRIRSTQLSGKVEASNVASTSQTTPVQPLTSPPSGRVRIAHVPNVSSLLDAKLRVQAQLKQREEELSNKTLSLASTPSVARRVAHLSPRGLPPRPIIRDLGGKIPANIRQKYLNILAEEYLKICSDGEEAFKKAIEEETAVHERCSVRSVYLSSMSNCISRLRKGIGAGSQGALTYPSTSKATATSSAMAPSSANPPPNRTVSHLAVLAGKGGTKGSWSIEKPKKALPLTSRNLYSQMASYVMTEEDLKANGYPHEHPEEEGKAIIFKYYKKPPVILNEFQRSCARCSKTYFIDKRGLQVKEDQCVYHWGRVFQMRVQRAWEGRYSCCDTPPDSDGCALAQCHVSDGYDPNALCGFVKTIPRLEQPSDGDYGVYALDCEMCYTVSGLELTRVTVVGSDLSIVYETLVKPTNHIIDYNTRFSGIKEGDLEDVTTTLNDVQCYLLELISDKTILVGHSLESDLKSLKIIHKTVVDTSIVFPHKMGPPKKRALKNLVREYLNKIIQCGDEGHDSAEDARACMELMLYKIKRS